MFLYSGSLQLRNLVPALFIDAVLVPGLGGGKSSISELRKWLEPIGIEGNRPEDLWLYDVSGQKASQLTIRVRP